jgi:hypothetical protein
VVYQLQTTAAAATTNGGAGFAFRKEVDGLRMQRTFGATFSAIATGQIPANTSHASLRLGRSPPPAPTWRGMHYYPYG